MKALCRAGCFFRNFSSRIDAAAGRITLTGLILTAVFCTILYYNPDRPLRLIGSLLVVDGTPDPADAIVVLLGGDSPSRVLKTNELYKQGLADKVAYSSGFVDQGSIKSAPEGLKWDPPSAQITAALISLGVNREALHVVPASGAFDTSHELQSVAAYAKKAGWKRVILVSSPSHTRRVSMVWRRVGGGLGYDTVAADEPGYQEWWKHGRFRRAVAYEYVAMIKEIWSQIVDWSHDADHKADENADSTSTAQAAGAESPDEAGPAAAEDADRQGE